MYPFLEELIQERFKEKSMADHHLVLDTNQVNQVLNILGTRPFNEVAPLIQKIAQQLQPAPPPPGNGAEQQAAGPLPERAPNG